MSRKQIIYNVIKAVVLCLITVGLAYTHGRSESLSTQNMIYLLLMVTFSLVLRTKELFHRNDKSENYKEHIIDSAVVLVFYLILLIPTKILLALNIDIPFIIVIYLATALFVGFSISYKNSAPAEYIGIVVVLLAFYLIFRLGYFQEGRHKLVLLILLGVMVAYSALIFVLKKTPRKKVIDKSETEQGDFKE